MKIVAQSLVPPVQMPYTHLGYCSSMSFRFAPGENHFTAAAIMLLFTGTVYGIIAWRRNVSVSLVAIILLALGIIILLVGAMSTSLVPPSGSGDSGVLN